MNNNRQESGGTQEESRGLVIDLLPKHILDLLKGILEKRLKGKDTSSIIKAVVQSTLDFVAMIAVNEANGGQGLRSLEGKYDVYLSEAVKLAVREKTEHFDRTNGKIHVSIKDENK